MGIGLIFSYMVFGNLVNASLKMWELKGQPNTTKDAMSSLSIVWTLILTCLSIIITALFSYVLWKNNESSLKISNELKNLEENRDYENKREKALIVYYDLQRGFNILKDLYIEQILNKKGRVTKKVFLSENWIENVASLRKDLNTKDINQLYNIYNILFTVQSFLEVIDEQQKFKQYLKEISDEIFNDFLPKALFDELNSTEIEDFLNIENYVIMHKLYKLTFNRNEITENDGLTLINNVNYSKVLKGDLYKGECILYNSYGYEKVKGHFFAGVFTTGNCYGYDGTKVLYDVQYVTNSPKGRNITKGILKNFIKPDLEGNFINATYINGTLIEGEVTEYYDDGKIKFHGSIVDGKRNGKCKMFTKEGKLKYEGLIDDSHKIVGKLYSNQGSLIFEGDFKDDSPWNGEIYKTNIADIKNFTGTIKNGKPFKGQGLIFKRSPEYDSYDEMIYQEVIDEIPISA